MRHAIIRVSCRLFHLDSDQKLLPPNGQLDFLLGPVTSSQMVTIWNKQEIAYGAYLSFRLDPMSHWLVFFVVAQAERLDFILKMVLFGRRFVLIYGRWFQAHSTNLAINQTNYCVFSGATQETQFSVVMAPTCCFFVEIQLPEFSSKCLIYRKTCV